MTGIERLKSQLDMLYLADDIETLRRCEDLYSHWSREADCPEAIQKIYVELSQYCANLITKLQDREEAIAGTLEP